MKVAITGANGYIGSALLSAAASSNFSTIALSRKRPASGCEWLFYDLEQKVVSLPKDVTCVVHLAMNFEINSFSEQENEIQAAIILAEAAKKIGARLIYISSQTASDSAPTMYGKTKWEIEKIVATFQGISIRPGLVYGGAPSGLFAQLTNLMQQSPFIPCFIPAPKVQPIHVNDLCKAILLACNPNVESKTICLASKNSIGFHEFLKLLSAYKLHKSSVCIPIPRVIIDLAYRIMPNNGALTRLHSLFNLPYMETENDLSVLGLQLRNLRSGLHHSGSYDRRLLLIEAYVLFAYLYREKPRLSKLRPYVKFIGLDATKEPFGFKSVIRTFPSLVALIENNSKLKNEKWHQELVFRLDVATALAEASSQGANIFLRLHKKNSFLRAVLILSKVVFLEALYRLAYLLFGFWVKRLIAEKAN